MRRTSLHTLKNLGFGKNILEDIIDDSVDNLIEHIDRNYLDKPIDVISFFHISVLSSLWRIISGEHLKMGDPKLEKLVFMVQSMVKEFGNPRTVISFNYVLLYQLINALGVIKITKSMHGVIDFTSDLMNDLKKRTIDGDNPLNLTEAFLHKIQEKQTPWLRSSLHLPPRPCLCTLTFHRWVLSHHHTSLCTFRTAKTLQILSAM